MLVLLMLVEYINIYIYLKSQKQGMGDIRS